ncbi:D-galacturonate reductase [Escovopsis weberi]|uniref:D-galacturonate reductase n=1 Tax=Escovopsis weberi TaxID=150374 RepID=A0A0M8N6P9_ESCWE|nr:D-galacturonate reductase [Escovopsis weberi]
MAVPTSFQLNTGAHMPAVGLGTWQSKPGEVEAAVSYALQNGYKLVDTAYCYANEAEVGVGIKAALDAGVKREDIFVVSKVWPTYLTRIDLALERSCKALGVDYIDAFLVYSKAWLEELVNNCTVVPAINQIELHPALPQQDVIDFCKQHGIHVMAYSPLGSTANSHFQIKPIAHLAEKKGVSPATILLSYHTARGTTVLPKSVTPARIKANLDIVHLDDEEMQLLRDYGEELTREGKLHRVIFPPFKSSFGFPDKA